jgi:branched-chain amino acid transport system permease protein
LFSGSILTVPGRVIALGFFLFLLFVPVLTSQPWLLRVISLAAIFAIYAASWDILAGFTGQMNLGHAIFFGVAAYTSALLNKYFGLPVWVTIPISSIAAVMVGLIVGIPALRIRGIYLALVTLAFPIILTGIIYVFPDFTGGEQGIYGLAYLSSSRVLNYYIVVLIMICSLLIMYKITDPKSKILRIGLMLSSLREDEITARASGIDTTRYKLMIFAISGIFGGIAGGIYAHYIRVVGPSTLEIFFSFQAILWTIFGGLGTIFGAVTGVFILFPLMEFATAYEFTDIGRFILYPLILILALIFMPEGLSVWIRDKIEVTCQRCKVVNIITRRNCRACRASLHLEKE